MPKNFRIAHRLWLAVVLIVVMLMGVLGYSGLKSTQVQSEADALNRSMDVRVQTALRWSGLTETNAARTTALIVSSDPAVEAEFKDAIATTSAQITEVQKSLEAMNLADADKAQMGKIATARSAMIELRGEARKLKAAGAHDQAVALVKSRYNPAVETYLQSLRDFVRQQEDSAKLAEQRMAEARTSILQVAAAMVAVLLLCIVGGAYFLIASIQQPLAQASGLAEHIAAGDLSQQANITRGDEFGDLLRSLYTMSHALGRMVHEVRQSTDSITTASAEIATGNHDLSARTEQTSSNLQETAAAMEQFTSTLQQSASSAQQASSLAMGATGVAQRGGAVVTQVVTTMEDINHSSKKIADIIGVIDGIAFQTNILALNAAVEAARAGEQGRGFAVVASEVRSLAQRSAEAAKEIKQLINASVEKVEAGTRLVSDAGATMTDIVQSVQRVTDMIGEITTASQEQSSGVVQVNQSIGQLDQMTQQNAALVEQSAAAAQSMREQADHLSQVVATFKVNAASYGSAQAAIGAARTSATTLTRPAASSVRAGAITKPKLASAVRPLARSAGRTPPAALPSSPAPAPAKPAATAGGQRAAADADWESF